ncbi:MAG TPA: hypothetical protein V6C72_07670 [Chroococcales cyanobacterium]
MSASDKVERKTFTQTTWLPLVVAAAVILLTELVSFGPIVKAVGFYLDDWITLRLLHDGPRPLWESFQRYLVSDPRVVVRPVEAFYYALEYFCFGLKPLGYHLVNGFFEVSAALFLFLSVKALTGNRSLSLLAAVLLIVYPNHDATHYWATCSSETLSLAFSLASVFFTLKAGQTHKLVWQLSAVFAFAISIFCYETFLPLLVLNVIGAFVVAQRQTDNRQALKSAALALLPFAGVVGSLLFYSRVIAPKLAVAQVHPVHIALAPIVNEIAQGIKLNLPDQSLGFFLPQLYIGAYFQTAPLAILGLVAVCAAVIASLYYFAGADKTLLHPLQLATIGLIVVVASYAIFGLNPEYTPLLHTILNRINYGAALGISLLIVGLLGFAVEWPPLDRRTLTVTVLAAGTLPIILFSIITNRGLAQPWILSWQTQKFIANALKASAAQFQNGDSIILANCPRYVMWAPLFDGVWDFEPMVRLTLSNSTLKGGVVSERIVVSADDLKDISRGTICGTYGFKRLFVVIPPHFQITQIKEPEKFIGLIAREGMTFGLSKSIIKEWQKQLAADRSSRDRQDDSANQSSPEPENNHKHF